MARRRKSGPKRKGRRRGGTDVGNFKKMKRAYGEITRGLGVRKGLASAGKMLMGTGLRKLSSFLNK
jgi:hypothetical protein